MTSCKFEILPPSKFVYVSHKTTIFIHSVPATRLLNQIDGPIGCGLKRSGLQYYTVAPRLLRQIAYPTLGKYAPMLSRACVPRDCYNPPLIYCTHTSPILYVHIPHTVCTPPPYCMHTSHILYAHLPHNVCTPPPYCMYTSPILYAHLPHTVYTPPPDCMHMPYYASILLCLSLQLAERTFSVLRCV